MHWMLVGATLLQQIDYVHNNRASLFDYEWSKHVLFSDYCPTYTLECTAAFTPLFRANPTKSDLFVDYAVGHPDLATDYMATLYGQSKNEQVHVTLEGLPEMFASHKVLWSFELIAFLNTFARSSVLCAMNRLYLLVNSVTKGTAFAQQVEEWLQTSKSYANVEYILASFNSNDCQPPIDDLAKMNYPKAYLASSSTNCMKEAQTALYDIRHGIDFCQFIGADIVRSRELFSSEYLSINQNVALPNPKLTYFQQLVKCENPKAEGYVVAVFPNWRQYLQTMYKRTVDKQWHPHMEMHQFNLEERSVEQVVLAWLFGVEHWSAAEVRRHCKTSKANVLVQHLTRFNDLNNEDDVRKALWELSRRYHIAKVNDINWVQFSAMIRKLIRSRHF